MYPTLAARKRYRNTSITHRAGAQEFMMSGTERESDGYAATTGGDWRFHG
jgi:hypothetical protein